MKLGKQGKINQEANRKLKILFESKGIRFCELCGSDNFLSYAHRHKRIFYYKTPELLWDFNQVLLLCTLPCHQLLEKDKKLTEETFNRLRGGIDNLL